MTLNKLPNALNDFHQIKNPIILNEFPDDYVPRIATIANTRTVYK